VIRGFLKELPGWVDGPTREHAEAKLAELSARFRPEQLRRLAAVLAKWAAPGMCDPDDQTATVDGEPSEEAARHDTRSAAQRNHDALNAGCYIRHHWVLPGWEGKASERRPRSGVGPGRR
jgi:hypothetical protein